MYVCMYVCLFVCLFVFVSPSGAPSKASMRGAVVEDVHCSHTRVARHIGMDVFLSCRVIKIFFVFHHKCLLVVLKTGMLGKGRDNQIAVIEASQNKNSS